jgi:hypothetical protein
MPGFGATIALRPESAPQKPAICARKGGMDLFARLLLYMSRWSRRPPSRRQAIAIVITLGLIAAIVAVERFVGWPDALTVERLPRSVIPR